MVKKFQAPGPLSVIRFFCMQCEKAVLRVTRLLQEERVSALFPSHVQCRHLHRLSSSPPATLTQASSLPVPRMAVAGFSLLYLSTGFTSHGFRKGIPARHVALFFEGGGWGKEVVSIEGGLPQEVLRESCQRHNAR